MIPGILKNFANATAREAYAVSSNEVGGQFYQLSDSSFWRAKAEGTGATAWQRSTGNSKVVVTLGDVSTKGSDAAIVRAPAPVAGKIVSIQSTLNAALATGDATLTGKIGSTAITDGALTATQSGSAIGDFDEAVPSALNIVAKGDMISVTVSGTSSATATAKVQVVIEEY